jgi:hypothetical protein
LSLKAQLIVFLVVLIGVIIGGVLGTGHSFSEFISTFRDWGFG